MRYHNDVVRERDMGTFVVVGFSIVISTWLTAWYMRKKRPQNMINERTNPIGDYILPNLGSNGDIIYKDWQSSTTEYHQLLEDLEYYKSSYEEEKRRRECFEHEYGELQKEINDSELQIKREHEQYTELLKRYNIISEKFKTAEERCQYLRRAISENDPNDILISCDYMGNDNSFSYDMPDNAFPIENSYNHQINDGIEEMIVAEDTQQAFSPNYVHRNYSSTPECVEISDSDGSVGDEASNTSLCHSPGGSEPDFELGNSIMHVIVDHTFLKEDFTRSNSMAEIEISELVQQNESMLNSLEIDEIVAYNSNCEDDEGVDGVPNQKQKKYPKKDESRIVQRECDTVDMASIPKISYSMQLWEGLINDNNQSSSSNCSYKTSHSNPCSRSSSPVAKIVHDSNSLHILDISEKIFSNSMNNLNEMKHNEHFEREETFNSLKSKWETFVKVQV